MNSTNNSNYFKPKCKGSKYSVSPEEYYEKGLEILNPSMKKFFHSLKVSPKVLFVKLHKFDKHSSNGCLYKLRNKSTIQFLTPSEVKQIAKKDVELMYSVMKRKILSLGKKINNSLSTISESDDNEISNQTFFKKKNFIQHIEENYTTCTHCNRKFLTLTSLKHHMKTRHSTIKLDSDDEFDKNYNRNSLSELSIFSELSQTKQQSSNDFSCEVLCCACLKIIVEVRPFLDSLVKNIYLSCLYCQLRISANYFLYHITSNHLSCKQDECHSKYINTGERLRHVLTMENEFECIHVDCDHYYFIDLNEPNVSVTVDDVDLSQMINQEEHCQDNKEIDFVITNANGEEEIAHENNLEMLPITDVEKRNESLVEEREFLSEDLQQISTEILSLQCSVCGSNFQNEQKLLRHLFNKHRFTHPFTCDVCFLSCEQMKELENHAQQHKTELIPLETNSEANLINYPVDEKVSPISENVEFFSEFEPTITEESENRLKVEKVETMEIEDDDSMKKIILQEEKMKNCDEGKIIQTGSTIFSNTETIPERISEREKSSSKNSKVKISCIVEKVEYPLDIHNLYAHIRKANYPTEINASELRLETSFNSDLPSLETSPRKRKISDSLEIEMNEEKEENHVESHTNFECTICDKTFYLQRPYSEHMFFMHDAEFQESVVLDILKSSIPETTASHTIKSNNNSKVLKSPPNDDKSATVMPMAKKPKIAQPSLTNNNNFKVLKKNFSIPTSMENLEIRKVTTSSNAGGKISILKNNLKQLKSKIPASRENFESGKVKVSNAEDLRQLKSKIPASSENFESGKVKVSNAEDLRQLKSKIPSSRETLESGKSNTEGKIFIFEKQITSNNLKQLKSEIPSSGENLEFGKVKNSENITEREKYASKREIFDNLTASNNSRELNTENENLQNAKTKEENTILLSNNYTCSECEKTFPTFLMLEKHKYSIHSGVTTTKKRVNGAIIDKTNDKSHLTCPLCKFIHQSPRSLQAHLMVNHNRATDICLLCNKLFSFGRGVRHILNFHILPNCSVRAKEKYDFFEDGTTKDDVNQIIKILGEKRLMKLCGYSNYRTILHDSTSFKCQYCHEFFTAIRYYRNHYLHEHDKFCTLCNLSFKDSQTFLLHLDNVHHSAKHYLWFTDTLISTILLTEKTKFNVAETFQEIIKRKLDQFNTGISKSSSSSKILDNLPQQESNLPEGGNFESCEEEYGISKTEKEIFQLPEFCMECEVSENGTLVLPNDNGLGAIIVENLSDSNNLHDKSESISTAFDTDVQNCILDYPIIISDNFLNNLQNDSRILTDVEVDTDNITFANNIQ